MLSWFKKHVKALAIGAFAVVAVLFVLYQRCGIAGCPDVDRLNGYMPDEASSIVDASPGNLNGETSTGLRLQSSLENVQEFRVESSNYPAEFGTGNVWSSGKVAMAATHLWYTCCIGDAGESCP